MSEVNNFYHTANRKSYYSAKYQGSVLSNRVGNCTPTLTVPNAGFAEFFPSIISQRVLQDSTREIMYDQDDTTQFVVNRMKLYYDNPVHYQLSRQVTTDSRGSRLVSKIKYPQDYIVSAGLTNNKMLDTLIRRNMLASAIEKRDSIYYPGAGTGMVSSASLTRYRQLPTGTVMPDKIYKLDIPKAVTDFQAMSVSGNTINQDSRYRQLINFDTYDNDGNLVQQQITDGPTVVVLQNMVRIMEVQ